jgi:hypothetical protein
LALGRNALIKIQWEKTHPTIVISNEANLHSLLDAGLTLLGILASFSKGIQATEKNKSDG